MIGDSLMGQHDVAFYDVLVDHGIYATVIDAHVNGSGLIGPVGDADSALAWVEKQVAEYPSADTVVIQWAGACAVCGTTVDGVKYPAIGDAEGGFYTEWVDNAIEIIDWLHDPRQERGVGGVAPMGLDSNTAASGSAIRVEACTILSMYDAAVLAPHASGALVDWTSALGDTNRKYAASSGTTTRTTRCAPTTRPTSRWRARPVPPRGPRRRWSTCSRSSPAARRAERVCSCRRG